MPLIKAKGNMYPWVTHTHTHLGGVCGHGCDYCYVQAIERRFKKGRYVGPLWLHNDELEVSYGKGRTIFIEHCNDLFEESVHSIWIERILEHCNKWPENTYIFQTKNPRRYWHWLHEMPPKRMLGCTVETMREKLIKEYSAAPMPSERCKEMYYLSRRGERVFVTVEPILAGDIFEMSGLACWMRDIRPEFVNIGADSKGAGLEEPTAEEVLHLLDRLEQYSVEVRQKTNLERIAANLSLAPV
jgi:DNA repair photolyase